MCVGSVLVAPVAVISGGRALLKPVVLGAGLVIGLLSSVIPYRFELETLRRVPGPAFGILVRLEPPVAARVWGALVNQALSLPRCNAISSAVLFRARGPLAHVRS